MRCYSELYYENCLQHQYCLAQPISYHILSPMLKFLITRWLLQVVLLLCFTTLPLFPLTVIDPLIMIIWISAKLSQHISWAWPREELSKLGMITNWSESSFLLEAYCTFTLPIKIKSRQNLFEYKQVLLSIKVIIILLVFCFKLNLFHYDNNSILANKCVFSKHALSTWIK